MSAKIFLGPNPQISFPLEGLYGYELSKSKTP